jgi:EAL domain-containing protein (putative c-di-GMP-specific phosphodiesterase class I)
MHVIKRIFNSALLSTLFAKPVAQPHAMLFMLRRAIQNQELMPFIQSIVDARTGEIVAGEVLMRWHHPVFGNISPECFIPLAEKSGLSSRITEFSIQSVARTIKSMSFIFSPETTLFFNVSAADFKNHYIVQSCKAFIRDTAQTDLRIGLEITEREAVEDSTLVKELCESLARVGVALSVDDFGTGNANYQYLMQFRPRYIKIDKIFINGIESDPFKEAIVRNIISLAHDLHCLTIAEGVETDAQRHKLASLGVSHFQGYLFSKPVAASVFFRHLMHTLPLC